MNLASLLVKERINLALEPGKKTKVIEELVYSMKKGTDAELIVSTLLKREDLGSTGIGKGIAVVRGVVKGPELGGPIPLGVSGVGYDKAVALGSTVMGYAKASCAAWLFAEW